MLLNNVAPLTTRNANEHIAYLLDDLPVLGLSKGPVTVSEFTSHVVALAESLPQHKTVINLCGNRYLLLLAFCAAIIRGQTNLLPPNHKPETQKRLQQHYPDSYIIHDGADVIENLPSVDLSHLELKPNKPESIEVAKIPLSHLAAISFTSGSTGDSKPNNKTWLTIVESTRINHRYMLPDNKETLYQLATVPAQHMWGLETSILLPLFANVCLSDAKPLFPLDIQESLAKLPGPRMIVSTPVHLRAMNASGIDFKNIVLLLCATSPLSQQLAQASETTFSSELREVYGCSEVGSMAVRQTARSDIWQLFEGIEYCTKDGITNASAEHLPEVIELQDNIELLENGQFRLAGRSSDMVNIAGKRGSLHDINQVLLSCEGLIDGQIFMPDTSDKQHITRLAAVVVLSDNYSLEQLRNYLQSHIDSAFVPRPIKVVNALPRSENGKLPHSQLLSFYRSLIIT